MKVFSRFYIVVLLSFFLSFFKITAADGVWSVDWNSTGQNFVLGYQGVPIPGINEIEIYSFDNCFSLTIANVLNPDSGLALTLTDSRNSDFGVTSVDWHPLENFLAFGSNGFGIYKLNFVGHVLKFTTGSPIISVAGTIFNNVRAVSWSPDGDYLAVAGLNDVSTDPELRIYSFNGSSITLVDFIIYSASSDPIESIDWHPHGNSVEGYYLAIGGYQNTSSRSLEIYSFDGSILTFEDGKTYGERLFSVAWSNDGLYLAIGGRNPSSGHELEIYSFDEISGLLSSNPVDSRDYGSSSSNISSITWSYDGLYVAIGGVPGGLIDYYQLQIYSFNDGFLSSRPAGRKGFSGANIDSIKFQPINNYILYGLSGSRRWGIEEFLGGPVDGRSKVEFKDYQYTFENADVATGLTYFNDGILVEEGEQATFNNFEGEVNGDVVLNNSTIKVVTGKLIFGRNVSATGDADIISGGENLKVKSAGFRMR